MLLLFRYGCYSQTHKEESVAIKEIDLVLGNSEKGRIVEIVSNFINNKNKEKLQVEDINNEKEFLELGITTYTEKTRAFIKVQDGCNNFCTYCLIPYARGRIRSRNKDNIIKEITEIVKNGTKEVVITGIHVASYGKDLKDEYYLIDLLEDINKIEGLEKIRLGSLEPTLVTESFVKRLVKLDKICNHFHLSLQSGCDETLKRMNRKYNTLDFKKAANVLRENFKDVALTADVIVGFPGETEEEFEKTYRFLQEIKFTKIHVFKYSKREGTLAAKMENQIDGEIKEERSKKIIALSDKYEKEFLDKQIGKSLKVLFEQQDGKFWKGHTSNYLVVKKEGNDLQNKTLPVRVLKRDKLELVGE